MCRLRPTENLTGHADRAMNLTERALPPEKVILRLTEVVSGGRQAAPPGGHMALSGRLTRISGQRICPK